MTLLNPSSTQIYCILHITQPMQYLVCKMCFGVSDHLPLAVTVVIKQGVKLCHSKVSSEQETNFLAYRGYECQIEPYFIYLNFFSSQILMLPSLS